MEDLKLRKPEPISEGKAVCYVIVGIISLTARLYFYNMGNRYLLWNISCTSLVIMLHGASLYWFNKSKYQCLISIYASCNIPDVECRDLLTYLCLYNALATFRVSLYKLYDCTTLYLHTMALGMGILSYLSYGAITSLMVSRDEFDASTYMIRLSYYIATIVLGIISILDLKREAYEILAIIGLILGTTLSYL